MINKIVVPLDGSALSEKALPYAIRLAKQLKAGLTLLRVEEWQRYINPNLHSRTQKSASSAIQKQPYSDTIQLAQFDEEEVYLQKVKASLTSPEAAFPLSDKQVEARVIYGKSPKDLPAVIKELKGDMVVMTTHGRSGLSLLMMGSIATSFIQHTTVPVILIKPTANDHPTPEGTFEPIVVTLDGSADDEAILGVASNLALQLGVPLHLLQVVYSMIPDITGQLYIPSNYNPVIEGAQLKEQAEKYLEGLRVGLKAKGLNCTTSIIVGDPVIASFYTSEPIVKIADYAQKVNAQLLAMATHARGRVGQVLLGSVSEEEVWESHLPVMLVRIPSHHKHESEN